MHDQFKALVEELLTNMLADMGIAPEQFYEIVAAHKDKLSSFVVNTILTVDDFQMFKSMMVKRNTELTQQVLFRARKHPSSVSRELSA